MDKKFMLVLKISNCGDCAYNDGWHTCTQWICGKEGRYVNSPKDTIPIWCPLEDYDSKGGNTN